MKKFFSISSILFLICWGHGSVKAQMANVGVDHFSGSASVSIPLYSLSYGKIPIPILLNYNGSGVKVKQVEGNAGLGWNLLVGGEVSRQVRGLPDDVKKDASHNDRIGWLHGGVGGNVSSFNFLNDNSQSTTGDEISDIYPLTYTFPLQMDTEPDVFYVNAPGINCKLVFDGNGVVRTIPHTDLKVSYETVTDGTIKGFQVTTEQGITYHFDKQEWITKTASNTGGGVGIKFFNREYERYKYGIRYVGSWKLSKVSDLGGYYLELAYTNPHGVVSKDRMEYAIGNTTALSPNFTNTITTHQIRPTSMSFSHDNGATIPDPDILYPTLNGRTISLSYTSAPTSSQAIVNGIYGFNKVIELNYVSKYSPFAPYFSRTLLKSLAINGRRSDFDYYGESQYEMDLPDSLSKKIDIWGYYNNSSAGSLLPSVYINPSSLSHERLRTMPPGISSAVYPYLLPGENRAVNASVIANGSLKKISYDDGGSTTIAYEPNTYHDVTAGAIVAGGGIRVKSITEHDGIDFARDQIRNFSYVDPATGSSSGKALSVPLLSFITPYTVSGSTEQQWQNSVVRMEENFSQENAGVIYGYVRESVAGAGSTLYQYKAPNTYWGSATADWSPTQVHVARPASAFGGYAARDINTYPFPPNQNYEYERGMLEKVTQFNENGHKVTETSYSYQRTGAPFVIDALVSEYNNAVLSYAKYPIYASLGNLKQQETVTKFDAPSTTEFIQSITNYSYASSKHKHPTLVTQTASDGSISRNYSKFVKDYDISSPTDEQSTALFNLQQMGVNFPVETYSQIEANGVNRTYGATLLKLRPWTLNYNTLNLPVQRLSFSNPVGVTDFSIASTNSGSFQHDARYRVDQQILNYNSYGTPLTVVGNSKVPQTSIAGLVNNRPLATFSNAALAEIAFNNFENDEFDFAFLPGYGGTYTTNYRSGQYAFDFNPSNHLSRTITKSSSRKEYILSVWVNSITTANITLSLSASGFGTSTYHLSVGATGGTYKYYELKVPVATLPATFTAMLQTNQQLKVDDVLFYPSDAIAATIAYDGKLNQTSATNTNGIAKYFDYDIWNRHTAIRDNEKNVIKKITYTAASDLQFVSPTLSNRTGMVNQSVEFYAGVQQDDFGSTSYTWNFGDGSAPVVTTAAFLSHVFTTVGNFTVSVTKSSTIYGNGVATAVASISPDSTPAKVGGPGEYVVSFYQGTTLVDMFTGLSLANGTASINPGHYTVVVSTPDRSFGSSNPYGHKKINYSVTTPSGTVVNCGMSPVNSYTTNLWMNVVAGATIYFSVGYDDCILEEL